MYILKGTESTPMIFINLHDECYCNDNEAERFYNAHNQIEVNPANRFSLILTTSFAVILIVVLSPGGDGPIINGVRRSEIE